MLADMEPRFELSFLDLVFGDQGLTQKILVDLGIDGTSTLRCNYYHQIHEVWPHTFGIHLFQKIRGHLDRMLLGTKDEWELSYTSAKAFLLHDAEKFSALEQIYHNPSHFAGWFLKTIAGNLFLHGSVPAEQNPSSVAAHLGPGASWSVVEQVSRLLERQKLLTAKRQQKESQAYVGSFKYMSSLQDQAGLDDETAKKQLSQYAYDKLWLVEYKASCHLQFVSHADLTIVWPNGKAQSCEEHVLISNGQRCSCRRRIAFRHQCRHELCVAGKLDLAKYSTCWLNRRSFIATMTPTNPQLPLFPSVTNPLSTSLHQSTSVIDNESSLSIAFDDDASRNSADEDSKDVVTLLNSDSHGTSKHGKLTYQFVAEQASNLVRPAQTDPITMASLSDLLEQLTNRLRNSQTIVVQSYDMSLPSGQENQADIPLLGTLKAAPNMYRQHRKISRHESRRQIIQTTINPSLSLVGPSNDLAILAVPRARGKTCSICTCRGHQ